MRVLLVGSGAREHALARKLADSPRLRELHAAPGNPGIGTLATLHQVAATDGEGVATLAERLATDLVVIGPEAPLVDGLADRLAARGLAAFGPSAAAARIEGSKAFAKQVMDTAGVPTARAVVCDSVATAQAAIAELDGRVVVKADGLAAGKGVFVSETAREAIEDARRCLAGAFGSAGRRVVVEERLDGREASVLALCDGTTAVALPAARDYKRIFDADAGPNTGGMGSVSPIADLDDDEAAELVARVHQPVLNELARRGAPFRGCLYAGLMLTESGPQVLEFNARFGDPETQAVLPRLEGDLLAALDDAARGAIRPGALRARADLACVAVVLAAAGYPESPELGAPIDGLDAAEALEGVWVLQAGTATRNDRLEVAGGRVLNVVATAPDPAEAAARAYAAAERISFAGMQLRHDIGPAATPSGV